MGRWLWLLAVRSLLGGADPVQDGVRLSSEEIDELKPLAHYLHHRWLEVSVNEAVVRLSITGDPSEPADLARTTCDALVPGDPDCRRLLEAHIRGDIEARPSFLAEVAAAAEAGGESAADATPNLVIDFPSPATRTVARADSLVFTWRVEADESFAIGRDGVACVVMRDERFKATINHACQATLDPSLGGPQLLSITGITPGDYAMYAQLRSKRLGIARSPLAVRRATVVAVGPRGDASTFETLALGDHEDPRAVAWVAAFLKGAPRRQGARVDRTRLLSEPLAIEFVYDGSHALAAARSLNASVGDLEACAHLGTSEENDVGHLIGCAPLDARASEVSFAVGARLASPAVREALGRARSYDASRLGDGAVDLTLSVAPLAITAHAQLRSAAAGASATRQRSPGAASRTSTRSGRSSAPSRRT